MIKKLQSLFLLGILFFLGIGIGNGQVHSLDEAIQLAKKENKIVFMNFSGSDWCKSCILLKKTILETEQFKNFAAKKLIILNVDFPRLKKNQLQKDQIEKNEKLAAEYNSKGQFPTIVLLDSNSKILGKTGYRNISPEQYIEHIESLMNQ